MALALLASPALSFFPPRRCFACNEPAPGIFCAACSHDIDTHARHERAEPTPEQLAADGCPSCTDGTWKCDTCDGQGHGFTDCMRNGEHSTDDWSCDHCGGEGRVPCLDCAVAVAVAAPAAAIVPSVRLVAPQAVAVAVVADDASARGAWLERVEALLPECGYEAGRWLRRYLEVGPEDRDMVYARARVLCATVLEGELFDALTAREHVDAERSMRRAEAELARLVAEG